MDLLKEYLVIRSLMSLGLCYARKKFLINLWKPGGRIRVIAFVLQSLIRRILVQISMMTYRKLMEFICQLISTNSFKGHVDTWAGTMYYGSYNICVWYILCSHLNLLIHSVNTHRSAPMYRVLCQTLRLQWETK